MSIPLQREPFVIQPTRPIPIASSRPRVIGVDVARAAALIGMMATHAFSTIDQNGDPTVATMVAGGRAATTFVLVAGISLAFLTGGRSPVHGRDRIGATAGLAIRALLIGAIGLALGLLGESNGIDGILPLYALMFLLAIPLLGLSPRVLIGLAAALTAIGPVLIVSTADSGLPYSDSAPDPSFISLITDPGGLLVQLLLTGAYPAVVYLAYLCVGIAIGRLDLSSRNLAWSLLGGGLAVAIGARLVSAITLYRLGGFNALIEQYGSSDSTSVATLLWEPEP